MNKICTDLEQSKRLQSLGIDVNTADMAYWKRSYQPNDYAIMVHHTKELQEGFEAKCIEYIPAWSLTALMELMNRNCYNVSLNCHGAEWNVKFDDSENYKDFTKDYAVDAAFEMIVWLLENKKL